MHACPTNQPTPRRDYFGEAFAQSFEKGRPHWNLAARTATGASTCWEEAGSNCHEPTGSSHGTRPNGDVGDGAKLMMVERSTGRCASVATRLLCSTPWRAAMNEGRHQRDKTAQGGLASCRCQGAPTPPRSASRAPHGKIHLCAAERQASRSPCNAPPSKTERGARGLPPVLRWMIQAG